MGRDIMRLPGIAFAALLIAGPASAQVEPSAAGRMSAAAENFLGALTDDQRARVRIASLDDDATRDSWSNLPAAMFPRDGVPVADLSEAQRIALHGLIAASLSSQGYLKAAQIMWADDILHEMARETLAAGGAPAGGLNLAPVAASWSTMNYWIRIYGDPADSRWAWSLNGHHLSLNFTVVDGRLAATPLFMGAEPEIVEAGRNAGWRVLPGETNRALELMRSLDDAQRAQALISATVDPAAFTGAGCKGREGEPRGVSGDMLTPAQQTLLQALIEEYTGNLEREAATALLADIAVDGPGALHFSWTGSWNSARDRFSYRVHGPAILIDYLRMQGVGDAPGNHIHTVMRDPRNDFGEEWLGRHYDEAGAAGCTPVLPPPAQ